MAFNWTDAALEKLRELWVREDYTASTIARILDQKGFLSRNAVIGKAARLKLPTPLARQRSGRNSLIGAKPPASKRAKLHKKYLPSKYNPLGKSPPQSRPQPSLPADPPPAPQAEAAVRLEQLSACACKWPLAEAAPQWYCGAPRAERGPYCPYHAAVASAGIPQHRESNYTNYTNYRRGYRGRA